jgi:uncharacterized protein (UPF0335 family)
MTPLNGNAQETLRRLVEQIERLEEEKRSLLEDITDKFNEAKSCGFDVRVLKRLLRIRRQSESERNEEQAIPDTYMHALGMTPIESYIEGTKQKEASSHDDETTVRIGDGEPIPLSTIKERTEWLDTPRGRRKLKKVAKAPRA